MQREQLIYALQRQIKPVTTWIKRGSFTIVDQALFSGANFLINILLARYLEPSQYGAFALVFSLFLLIGTFHTAIFTEPMMVFGAGKYRDKFENYIGFLIRCHLSIMVPISLVLLVVSLALGKLYSEDIQKALIGLAIAGPMILLLWLVRQAFYVRLQPHYSAMGGGLYFILVITLIYFMQLTKTLTQLTTLLGMGLSAFVVGLISMAYLRPQFLTAGDPGAAMVMRSHWRYGRWSLGSAGLTWLPGNIYYVILPGLIGLDGVAALRALRNLIMPMLQVINSLGFLLLPLLSSNAKEEPRRMGKTMGLFLSIFITASVLYLVLLSNFRSQVLMLLYRDKYLNLSSLVPIVALLPISASVSGILGNALRALERPDRIFWSFVASSGVALVIGFPLASAFGIGGALFGSLLSSLASIFLMYVFFRGLSR
jgi:O-antigen/teichoic acid export membrane protein